MGRRCVHLEQPRQQQGSGQIVHAWLTAVQDGTSVSYYPTDENAAAKMSAAAQPGGQTHLPS